jgi:hypothetical protein
MGFSGREGERPGDGTKGDTAGAKGRERRAAMAAARSREPGADRTEEGQLAGDAAPGRRRKRSSSAGAGAAPWGRLGAGPRAARMPGGAEAGAGRSGWTLPARAPLLRALRGRPLPAERWPGPGACDGRLKDGKGPGRPLRDRCGVLAVVSGRPGRVRRLVVGQVPLAQPERLPRRRLPAASPPAQHRPIKPHDVGRRPRWIGRDNHRC